MKKKSVIISLAGIIVIILFYGYLQCGDKRAQHYEMIRQNCERLEVGMSRAEVRGIMGEPKDIGEYEVDGVVYEKWMFDAPIMASTPPQCIFNKKEGKVIGRACRD